MKEERIIFKKNNLIYGQDMSQHIGIPENVEFTFVPCAGAAENNFTLEAFGYGLLNKGKGSYGNGQLFVRYSIKELREHSIINKNEGVINIFSGEYSRKMWAEINTAKTINDLRDALYGVCCKLQELETKYNDPESFKGFIKNTSKKD